VTTPDCTCGNQGICTVCVLADLEPREPTDDDLANGFGMEGGIAYDTTDNEPGSLGENDPRL